MEISVGEKRVELLGGFGEKGKTQLLDPAVGTAGLIGKFFFFFFSFFPSGWWFARAAFFC